MEKPTYNYRYTQVLSTMKWPNNLDICSPSPLGRESSEAIPGRKRRNSHQSAVFGEAGNGAVVGISELVPVVGLEPTRYRYRRILNPLRLPIPSHRQIWIVLYKLFFRNARGRLTDFPAISSPELEELRGKGIPRPPWACSKAPQEPSARRGPRGKRGLAVQALSFETRM